MILRILGLVKKDFNRFQIIFVDTEKSIQLAFQYEILYFYIKNILISSK